MKILKICWIFIEDLLEISWTLIEDLLKIYWRLVEDLLNIYWKLWNAKNMWRLYKISETKNFLLIAATFS